MYLGLKAQGTLNPLIRGFKVFDSGFRVLCPGFTVFLVYSSGFRAFLVAGLNAASNAMGHLQFADPGWTCRHVPSV